MLILLIQYLLTNGKKLLMKIKRLLIWMLLFSIVSTNLNAQEPLKHQKKMYVNENGRFFINKTLPVYLRLSTSPEEEAESHLLKSETSPRYSNPFYFDTEGYNTIRTPSQVDTVTKKVILPKQDIIFEVYTDSESPDTKIDYGTTPKHRNKGYYIYGEKLEVELSATDKTSGVEQILYSINKAPFKKYKAPLNFDKEKHYIIKYYSVDNVGNAEEVKTVNFTIDLTPPSSEYIIDGDINKNILSGRTSLSLKASDDTAGVAKIYYTIDDLKQHIYTKPIRMYYLSEGEHSITYYSVDKVKNKESEKSYTFYIDKTPPNIIEEVMGDKFIANGVEWISGRSKMKLTAIDNKAGVRSIHYTIGGEYQVYEKPFYLPNESGSQKVKFYAVDKVNNKSLGNNQSSSNMTMKYHDLTGPSLKYQFLGATIKMHDTVFISPETKIKLLATDPEAGVNNITYSLDKAEAVPYESSFTIAKEGLRQIDYIGYDNVNNSNGNNFFFIVDATGPKIYPHYNIAPSGITTIEDQTLNIYPKHLILYLSATDALVGTQKIFYSINGTPEKLYNSVISGFRNGSQYKIQIRAVDYLGNQSKEEIQFKVE